MNNLDQLLCTATIRGDTYLVYGLLLLGIDVTIAEDYMLRQSNLANWKRWVSTMIDMRYKFDKPLTRVLEEDIIDV